MGAMAPTGRGTYRYDGTASGIQYYDTNHNRWVDQSKTGGTAPIKVWDSASGRLVDQNSPQGKALQDARKKKAEQWANASKAAEMEAVNAQEVEDRIAENKDRNAQINDFARQQAGNGMLGGGASGPGVGLGRGIYQRRQTGAAAGSALAGLNNANAAALADARRRLVGANQKANVGYQNPMVGYAGALSDIASKLPKPGETGLGSLMGLT